MRSTEQADRRRFLRVEVPLLIQYRTDPNGPLISDYSMDLSTGGAFLRTDSPHQLGTLVEMQLTFREGLRIYEGLGKVVRVVHSDNPEGQLPGMGIEFVGFDQEALVMIRALVTKIDEEMDG